MMHMAVSLNRVRRGPDKGGLTMSVKRELKPNEKKELQSSIRDFARWLHKIRKVRDEPAGRYATFTFTRPSSADWLMLVDGSEVRFNTWITGKCSFEYDRTPFSGPGVMRVCP